MNSKSAINSDIAIFENTYLNLGEAFFEYINPTPVRSPALIYFNKDLANFLGLGHENLGMQELSQIFSGNLVSKSAVPIALAYAGHQFGHFVPQLGDGRAILLGEVCAPSGRRFDIQLKGSGRTRFSRLGDGRAALGPVLRECIVSEAMHVLNIPTTRALAAVTTGEDVARGISLPGAVFTRVAASHIRFGTFEYFAAKQDVKNLRILADYAIARHYPSIAQDSNPYLSFLARVISTQASLIARWLQIGFVHGVMNTDNMTISGETIDYGPCAFIDEYHPGAVFSSIDTYGRYSYGNQPAIAEWNLTRLGESLLTLIDQNPEHAIQKVEEELSLFQPQFQQFWLSGMYAKLGINTFDQQNPELLRDLLVLMEEHQPDFTLVFRYLSDVLLLPDSQAHLQGLFKGDSRLTEWLAGWRKALEHERLSLSEISQR